MINVIVKFFAFLRDEAGVDECRLTLESGSCGLDVRKHLAAGHPRLAGLLRLCRLAVNLEYAKWDVLLRDGDELSLIPPVSGG